MNKIIYQYNSTTQLTFADEGNFDGVLLEGSFYNETSLLEDELSIDTMKIRVRSINTSYPLHNFIYGSQVIFYKDDVLYGKYYLVSVERQTKNEYILNVQSSIGLLDDTMHYGGIYSGEYASAIIQDIIGGKIAYTEHNIFSKIKVYGWLPVATRRENLKQLLFAVGGCVKKKGGDVYFTTLTVDAPKAIPENKVFDTGKITYDSPASRIEVDEHQFSKVDSAPSEEVYSGEIPAISEEGAENPLPKNDGLNAYKGLERWITMSRMYYWAQEFQKRYPNEFQVYFENDNFVCYHIEQNVYSLYNFAIDYGYN